MEQADNRETRVCTRSRDGRKRRYPALSSFAVHNERREAQIVGSGRTKERLSTRPGASGFWWNVEMELKRVDRIWVASCLKNGKNNDST